LTSSLERILAAPITTGSGLPKSATSDHRQVECIILNQEMDLFRHNEGNIKASEAWDD